MKQTYRSDLPPLPTPAASGSEVCAIIGLYLAVWDDLDTGQQQAVSRHVQICVHCTAEQQRLHTATRLVQHLSESSPSACVDQAVTAAIAARASGRGYAGKYPPLYLRVRSTSSIALPWRVTILVATAMVVLFAVVTTVRFTKLSGGTSSQTFLLPATLTWAGFVLYHSETRMGKNGQRYAVIAYHNMRDGHINVETVQQGMLDVVAVSDEHETLGLDMMHHVAQWGADSWIVDESMFNLGTLQNELRNNQSAYLGTAQYNGISVYRIRCENGLVLLLDRHYMPVNVLRGAGGTSAGEPVYDTLRLLPPSQVSATMWNMHVPAGFTMGTLPATP